MGEVLGLFFLGVFLLILLIGGINSLVDKHRGIKPKVHVDSVSWPDD